MLKRLILATVVFVAVPTVTHADETCAANFLGGTAKYVIDAATGSPMEYLPYAAPGYAGGGADYAIDLGGGGFYKPPVTPPPPPVEPPQPLPVPFPPPPVQPEFMDDLALAPNDAGATRLVFPGNGTGRLTGPNTDFIFTGVDPTGLFVDGDLIARGGSGLVNGQQTTAVPDASGATLRVGSGFNVTRTRGVNATFANGTVLRTVVLIGDPPPSPGGGGFSADAMLTPNAIGATRLRFPGDGTAILTGPGTSVIFSGVDASGLARDAPVIARSGSGTVNGRAAVAVPLFDEGGPVVLTLSAGFNPTGTQAVRARFSTGAMLEAEVVRN